MTLDCLFTVLMLAYFNGNANLCRAVVRTGAMMGQHNKDGVSIFNAPVATKQLLCKLLGGYLASLERTRAC